MKKRIFALLVLLVFLLSSFTFIGRLAPAPTLESNILNFELDEQTQFFFLTQGKTLILFKFSPDCENCWKVKKFLEDYATYYRDQLILQKVTSNQTSVRIWSIYGTKIINELNTTLIEKAFCELMVNPPPECIELLG